MEPKELMGSSWVGHCHSIWYKQPLCPPLPSAPEGQSSGLVYAQHRMTLEGENTLIKNTYIKVDLTSTELIPKK
jgi:hypothetical protein